jgi:hypothetical protein
VYVVPVLPARQNGYYFVCTTAGVSGGTEPVWPSTVGATVTDNTVVWTCIGRSGIYPISLATPDSYYANGAVQSLYFDTDPAQIVGNLVDAGTYNFQFYFPLAAIDPSIVLTSFTLSYGRIRLLGQE